MTQRLDHQKLSPEGARALGGVYMHVGKSGLPATLIDLVYLRVSQINGCAYCIVSHARDLQKAGVSAQKLLLLPAWREAPALFTEQEQAALQWAESLTLVAQTHAPDEDYQRASAQFSERQLVDLSIAIGLINTYNRLAIGFRRTPEFDAAA